jgi:hypothetical protein
MKYIVEKRRDKDLWLVIPFQEMAEGDIVRFRFPDTLELVSLLDETIFRVASKPEPFSDPNNPDVEWMVEIDVGNLTVLQSNDRIVDPRDVPENYVYFGTAAIPAFKGGREYDEEEISEPVNRFRESIIKGEPRQ